MTMLLERRTNEWSAAVGVRLVEMPETAAVTGWVP
jgi:hypothetical protein